MQNQNEQPGTGQRINDFIQKNRKTIIIAAGALALILVISIAAFSINDILKGKAVSAVEELNSRYESIRHSINEEYMESEAAALLAELETFAEKNSGYAGGKAWSIIGSIYSEKKDWSEAEAAWAEAAAKSEKSYLAPVAWFNAGIAAEEQGKIEEAIDYFSKSLSAPAGFSSAPRAQFSIGRLNETLDNREAAIAAYRAVIAGWPYDAVWTNLAHSKIIALEL